MIYNRAWIDGCTANKSKNFPTSFGRGFFKGIFEILS